MNAPLAGETQTEIRNHEVFLYGESDRIGGVGLILGGDNIKAWKDAGSKPPIKKSGRLLGPHLTFTSGNKELTKLFIISAFLPCTRQSDSFHTRNSMRFWMI
jgi:hypothetical protein